MGNLYTILMDNNSKRLIATRKVNLRQHENLVDHMCFIIKPDYFGTDLSEFSASLYWLDPTNVAHVDVLHKEDEPYKDFYQRYFLPVDSKLNRYAGNIEMKLVFTKIDYACEKRYRLESEPITVEIKTIKDYYSIMPEESYDAIENLINKLQSQTDSLIAAAEVYEKSKADNIAFNEDGDIQLQSNTQFIGNAISVAVPGTTDDEDSSYDGIVDLDEIYQTIML